MPLVFWFLQYFTNFLALQKNFPKNHASENDGPTKIREILKKSIHFCVTISDDYISKTVKYLANSGFSDEKIIGGECSTPGIASLVGLINDHEVKNKISLNESSNVLLFGCEGAADEELYQKLLSE